MRAKLAVRRFGEVCEIIKGRRPQLKGTPDEGDLPYLVAKVMRGTEEAEYASPSDPDAVVVAENETIIICDGSNSGEVFTGFRGVLSSTMGKLKKREPISDPYLRAFLSSAFLELNEGKTGAAIPHLDKEALYRTTIPLPPIPEQERIVGILDKAFAGIATARARAERNLENARALFQSRRHAMLARGGKNWSESALADLCDIKHGFAFRSEFFAESGDHVLLTPGNFFESGGYRDRGEKQKYYQGPIPGGFVLSVGDLLVVMTEQAAGLLGSPALVPESRRFLHNQRLGLVRGKPGVPWTNEFFFHVFNTDAVRKAIFDSASGTKVRHTSPTKIGEVVVAFPNSEAEQRKIVADLAGIGQEVHRLGSIYKRRLAEIASLRNSLLHRAFAGQL